MAKSPTYEELLTARARFEEKLRDLHRVNGCLVWSGAPQADGYGQFTFSVGPGKTNKRLIWAHQAAFQLVFGPLPEGHGVVRHTCDNAICVASEHLVSGTHAENVQDRVDRNRSVRGADHGRAKLSEETVEAIIRRFRAGGVDSIIGLARGLGVDPKAIRLIRDRKNWAHVWDRIEALDKCLIVS